MLYQQNCLLYSYPIQRFYLFSESRLAATHHQNALMSFVKVWVHAVWGTKHREPVLIKEKRDVLFRHIKDNALSKNIYIDCINGHLDHVHCLFELNAEIPLAKTIQLLKGEASHWANKQNCLVRIWTGQMNTLLFRSVNQLWKRSGPTSRSRKSITGNLLFMRSMNCFYRNMAYAETNSDTHNQRLMPFKKMRAKRVAVESSNTYHLTYCTELKIA
jgi:REP element-mobilizing transposase RayT